MPLLKAAGAGSDGARPALNRRGSSRADSQLPPVNHYVISPIHSNLTLLITTALVLTGVLGGGGLGGGTHGGDGSHGGDGGIHGGGIHGGGNGLHGGGHGGGR